MVTPKGVVSDFWSEIAPYMDPFLDNVATTYTYITNTTALSYRFRIDICIATYV